MGRIRTVKPEFFLHEELYDVEQESGLPVRLAFIGLWTCCDREGRFKWRPRTLKSQVLPFDDVDFSRVLDALTTRGYVQKYAADGDDFGLIPTFSDHQSINNKEAASKIPPPNDLPRDGHACSTRAENFQGERKGKEGKGKEKKSSLSGASDLVIEAIGGTDWDVPPCRAALLRWVTFRHAVNAPVASESLRQQVYAMGSAGRTAADVPSIVEACIRDEKPRLFPDADKPRERAAQGRSAGASKYEGNEGIL